MHQDQRTIIAATLAKAPDWVRQDLLAKDAILRQRAEETIAAMIAVALASREHERVSESLVDQVSPSVVAEASPEVLRSTVPTFRS